MGFDSYNNQPKPQAVPTNPERHAFWYTPESQRLRFVAPNTLAEWGEYSPNTAWRCVWKSPVFDLMPHLGHAALGDARAAYPIASGHNCELAVMLKGLSMYNPSGLFTWAHAVELGHVSNSRDPVRLSTSYDITADVFEGLGDLSPLPVLNFGGPYAVNNVVLRWVPFRIRFWQVALILDSDFGSAPTELSLEAFCG